MRQRSRSEITIYTTAGVAFGSALSAGAILWTRSWLRDRDGLLEWLAGRPLLHEDRALNVCMLHAGLAPQWSLPLARRCAREVESVLQRDPERLFERLYGDEPDRWDDSLQGEARLRFIVNCFTRLRYVDVDGRLMLRARDHPKESAAAVEFLV
jgi:bis(5'-nucleosyl)-tetraphosphatase (symmetrical)